MTMLQSRTLAAAEVACRRPALAAVTAAVLIFLGITAVGGGIALIFNVGANPPAEWLEDIPVVDTWLVPGLVLGAGFGLGSLVAAYGVLHKPNWPWLAVVQRLTGQHWSWTATMLIGLSHMVWIALELIYLREPSVLQAVYGGVGVALFGLPWLTPVRTWLRVDRP